MRRILCLTVLGGGLVLTACKSAQSGAGTDARPRIMGSNNLPQTYYDDLRQKVAPATGLTPATDPEYGVTQQKPVCVGDKARAHNYLNALRGPQGQEIHYRRLGSCCPFNTPNGLVGGQAVLNPYELTWEGQQKPLLLYINSYDTAQLQVPVGLTLARP